MEIVKGVYKLRLPVKYFDPKASEEDKATRKAYEDKLDSILNHGGGGISFPAVTDENGNYLFDLTYVGPN